MATQGHTLKAFDEDLDRLRALISEMGGLAEHAIGEAMRCLTQRDVDGAHQVIEDDTYYDPRTRSYGDSGDAELDLKHEPLGLDANPTHERAESWGGDLCATASASKSPSPSAGRGSEDGSARDSGSFVAVAFAGGSAAGKGVDRGPYVA